MRRKAHKYKTRKPVQERSQATFEAIIEATAQILERDGLAGLSTNRVARVAGVSVGSLYQYFPDKQALVEEVRSRFAARFQSRLLELVGRLPGLGLRQAIREWV
jgi:AcrR family transcriptional regulator